MEAKKLRPSLYVKLWGWSSGMTRSQGYVGTVLLVREIGESLQVSLATPDGVVRVLTPPECEVVLLPRRRVRSSRTVSALR